MNKLRKDILRLLGEDARYGHERLATMLGASVADVTDAVNELEKDGVIVKYSVVIDEEKLDYEIAEAMIKVGVIPEQTRGFDAIAEEIYTFPEVRSVFLMSGSSHDLAVIIAGKTLKEVAMFVSEKLAPMKGVSGTATSFILKKYKTDGVILSARNEGGNRLSVQP